MAKEDDSENESSGDYAVGYKKPPAETRWKPGQSGNPRGRRAGSKNLKTLLKEILNDPITVTVGGKKRRMTKGEAMLEASVNRAMKGDQKALATLVNLSKQLDIDGPEEGSYGVLVVPAQLPMDEWEKVASKSQAKYRDPSYLRKDEDES